jgi:hypothetical protein
MAEANTLAYYDTETIAAIRSFIVMAHGVFDVVTFGSYLRVWQELEG